MLVKAYSPDLQQPN